LETHVASDLWRILTQAWHNNDSQLETSPTSQLKYVFLSADDTPWLSVSPISEQTINWQVSSEKYPISGIDEETQSCSQWNPHWWKTKRYSIWLLKPAIQALQCEAHSPYSPHWQHSPWYSLACSSNIKRLVTTSADRGLPMWHSKVFPWSLRISVR
jgi:hypothetical protein